MAFSLGNKIWSIKSGKFSVERKNTMPGLRLNGGKHLKLDTRQEIVEYLGKYKV